MFERQPSPQRESYAATPSVDFEALQRFVEVLTVTDNFIQILVTLQPRCECMAHVTLGTLYCKVKTIQADGRRHPFFVTFPAHALIHGMIEYFECFHPVQHIGFYWQRPSTPNPGDRSDNYTAYLQRKLALAGRGLADKELCQVAAKATWTYNKIAVPMRFWQVSAVHEMKKNGVITKVDGTFSR